MNVMWSLLKTWDRFIQMKGYDKGVNFAAQTLFGGEVCDKEINYFK